MADRQGEYVPGLGPRVRAEEGVDVACQGVVDARNLAVHRVEDVLLVAGKDEHMTLPHAHVRLRSGVLLLPKVLKEATRGVVSESLGWDVRS